MRCNFLKALFISFVLLSFLLCSTTVQAGPLKVNTSTQFIWGDDLLGEGQAILSQYVRFSFTPEGKKLTLVGYGRVWDDLAGGEIRDNDFGGRLYYLYLDYDPVKEVSMRLGRQFVNFSASSTILDGASVSVRNIGPLGILLAGGRNVVLSMDSEETRNGNYFVGIDVHLERVKNTQLGVSYVRKYDDSDLAREEFGMNFRYFYKLVSPYAEVRYDRLSEAIDEATLGLDFFPMNDLTVKAEFYHSYPTFDSTSIYSVFAVDKYREYLLRAEYSLKSPVTLFGSYARQTYEEDSNADTFTAGARFSPLENLKLSASIDYRHGYGGNLWGFEVTGDYKINDKIQVAAGIQYDTYKRPDENGNNDAQRYWAGGRWAACKNISVSARLEDNVNEKFSHRPLGRVTLDWKL